MDVTPVLVAVAQAAVSAATVVAQVRAHREQVGKTRLAAETFVNSFPAFAF